MNTQLDEEGRDTRWGIVEDIPTYKIHEYYM
jgi:hypothetical protein